MAEKTETRSLDHRKLRAMSVVDAVEYVFRLRPTRAALILGPPGIGKTETVIRRALIEAQKLGKEPVFLNEARATMTMDEYVNLVKSIIKSPEKYYVITVVPFGATMPDDLLGVPNLVKIEDEHKVLAVIEESALKGSLAVLTVKGVHGALIIDDALNANDHVRRSFLQAAFQERLVGGFNGVKLSPNVRLIATGNLASESELATPLQRAMVGRAVMIYTKPEELKSWYKHMNMVYGDEWFKDVYAFLTRYERFYNNPDLIEDEIPTGPVPRAWTALAVDLHVARDEIERLLKEKDSEKLIQIVSAYVGVEAATHFVSFIMKPIFSVEEVLKNPGLLDEISKDLDVVFRFATHLATKLEKALLSDQGDAFKYARVLVSLMEKTTNDVAVFVYESLSPEAKKTLKLLLREWVRSSDGEVARVGRRLRSSLINMAIADVLLSR